MLEAGRYRSAQEIADAEKIDRSFVSRLLDLTLLAPVIQEAILEGRQPKGLQLEELMRAVPGAWEEQRKDLACPRPAIRRSDGVPETRSVKLEVHPQKVVSVRASCADAPPELAQIAGSGIAGKQI